MSSSPTRPRGANVDPAAGPLLRSTKRQPLAKGLTKSASESSVKKKQQSCLLDQELLVLERDDGKRHARELSQYLLEYAKKIEELQNKNRRLEEELSFDDHVTREDPFFNDQVAEKLSDLYLQGNNFMIRLELERKEIARLNALIQRNERALAQQKTKIYELAALDHTHALLVGRIRKMENDIDRRIVKVNEKLAQNRKLRETIDAQRNERARMDAIYTKIANEAFAKKHKMMHLSDEVEKLRDDVHEIEQEIERIRQEGEEWEMKCDREATLLLQELKELALHQQEMSPNDISLDMTDVEKYKYLAENDLMRNVSAAQEALAQSRTTRTRWKTGQAKMATDAMLTKYQENRTIIEKIHEVSGTTTVSEMIDAFNKQYPFFCDNLEHFDRIQYVNQLAEDIENHRQISAKLREDIGKLKQRKDSVDFQRMNRIEGLKARLQFTHEQKKHKEEANQNLQAFLAALKPAILQLHTRIGCSEGHNDNDVKKVLGEIEEQVVTILQKYHAKHDAKTSDETTKEHVGGTSNQVLSPASSSSTHKDAVTNNNNNVGGHSTREALTTTNNDQDGNLLPTLPALSLPSVTNMEAQKPLNFKSIAAFLSKEQPYRYVGLRPPHLSMEELKKNDNIEEEYPLTYDELKSKVWHVNGA